MNVSKLLSDAFSRFLSGRVGRMAGVLALGLLLGASPTLAQDAVTVSMLDTSAAPGDTVAVPVEVDSLDEAEDILSFDITLKFDGSSVSFAGTDEENTLVDDGNFSIAENTEANQVSGFALSETSLNDVADSGVLIRLLLVKDESGPTTISLDPFQFNEGNPPVEPAVPEFTVRGNRAPTGSVSLPHDTLLTPGPPLELTGLVGTVFTDPDGDQLSLSASSSVPAVVSVPDRGPTVVALTPESVGTADVTITASDGQAETSITFEIVVEERPDEEDEPTEQSRSTVASSESEGAEASFGDTGVKASFQDVQGSGTVTVGFVPDSSATGDPSFSESFENVSVYRWDIDNEGTNFGSADVAFSLSDSDVVGVEDPSSVTILVADNPDGTFETVDTDYDSDREVLVANGLTSFSTFRLASNSSDNPLPVEMAAFSASATESGALLEWRTASETGNAGFEVQHQEPGAPAFNGVGFVEGAGTTSSPQSYRYRLSSLEPGTHRFRLQQRDVDGATSLTDPVTVSIKAERALTFKAAGPNPVREETRLTFTVRQSGSAEVTLYNVLGQQVRTLFSRTARVGERYAVTVGADGLPTGKYFAQLSGSSGTRTQQIVIAN
jgi:hypothetical protein